MGPKRISRRLEEIALRGPLGSEHSTRQIAGQRPHRFAQHLCYVPSESREPQAPANGQVRSDSVPQRAVHIAPLPERRSRRFPRLDASLPASRPDVMRRNGGRLPLPSIPPSTPDVRCGRAATGTRTCPFGGSAPERRWRPKGAAAARLPPAHRLTRLHTPPTHLARARTAASSASVPMDARKSVRHAQLGVASSNSAADRRSDGRLERSPRPPKRVVAWGMV